MPSTAVRRVPTLFAAFNGVLDISVGPLRSHEYREPTSGRRNRVPTRRGTYHATSELTADGLAITQRMVYGPMR